MGLDTMIGGTLALLLLAFLVHSLLRPDPS
ncbi:MAG: potassium-transporting ATPase subunit F [Nannocystaceae bacterium]|nr:potassium-transporting ATPase subunit F [Nannocystaceae bacterium]